MSRVLVVGARGMMGASLCPKLKSAGYEVVRQSRVKGFELCFDPSDEHAWHSVLHDVRPEVVVNLAAATDVDRCEDNPQWAYDANVKPLLSLLQASSLSGVQPYIVHISTDQVYDGEGPHCEKLVRPCNVYALSKMAGELALCKYHSAVLRTNFFGASRSSSRRSFSDWIVNSLRFGLPITVFDDVLFSALHLDSLCDVVIRALEVRPCGAFNVGTSDGISKADFAFELAGRLGLPTHTMGVGSVNDLNLRARRPLDMRLNPARFEHAFGMVSPTMSAQISYTAEDYNEK